jgi:hypothetical protein
MAYQPFFNSTPGSAASPSGKLSTFNPYPELTYDKQILQILTDVGERGISVMSLAKHVYNQNCTFFSTPDFEEIRSYVQQYLLKNSKSQQSLIENTGRRGFYRLNTMNNADAQQLMLQFGADRQTEETVEPPKEDLSLSLFD